MNTTSIIRADLNEILFADRNKDYGAYQIRKSYPRTLLKSFFFTAAAAVGLLLLLYHARPVPEPPSEKTGIVKFTKYEAPEKPPAPPKPLKEGPTPDKADPKPQQKGMDTEEAKVAKPTADADPEASIAPDSAFKDKQPGTTTTDSSDSNAIGGDPNGTADTLTNTGPQGDSGDGGNQTTTNEPSLDDVHWGEMPVPLNIDAISKAIGYPKPALEAEMEGKAVFRVLVDETGRYVRHAAVHVSHPLFLEACERQLPGLEFRPGMMGDRPVKVWVTIPFRFRLPR